MTVGFLTPPTILISIYLLSLNLIAYIAFYVDKKRARQQLSRIPESTLLLIALFGGTIGAITAQHQFRHKTLKQPFKFQLYCIAILQLAFVIMLLFPDQRGAMADWVEAWGLEDR
ncbi:hypothetical protein GCM10011309_01400 [Litorimonas cladophorae]|uniref:DUF1294 domain-containing protein n=1 Tax=Litorimonas cladophorae TaxID=1220491 RepID=A0A918NAI8_9PROT|nr:DUF1294 domain-containing protein [Litorimonas cladophorae]GGX56366.1 hypothetical protein GCM10011309_01400 [Litorimonas cladophorae]